MQRLPAEAWLLRAALSVRLFPLLQRCQGVISTQVDRLTHLLESIHLSPLPRDLPWPLNLTQQACPHPASATGGYPGL